MGASPVRSQTQEIDGYTIVGGALGPQVCLGKWVPSSDVVMPGTCNGQLVGPDQLAAISSRLSADRLDKLLFALSSIDQKLAVNNDQVFQLLKTSAETQSLLGEQVSQANEFLRGAIAGRFDKIPEELLSSDLFRDELEKLKEDILKEVEKYYSKLPAPSTKQGATQNQ